LLAVAGVGLLAVAPDGPLLGESLPASTVTMTAVLVALFLLAELGLIHVEFRRQAWSFSLSGIPLVLGLLHVGSRELVLARLCGAGLAFALQRSALIKVGYNLCAYVLEAAFVATVTHALLPDHGSLTLATAAGCYLVVMAADITMSLLVLVVIRVNGGTVGSSDIVGVLAPAAAFSVAATAFAFIAALLLREGALGGILLATFAAGSAWTYRSHVRLRRRHQALARVHEFVADGDPAGSTNDLAGRLVSRTRSLLRAANAELIITDPDGRRACLAAHEGRDPLVNDSSSLAGDWLVARVEHDREPIIVSRSTRDPVLRRWLVSRGLRDALLVPVDGPGPRSVLLVTDRLGDTATFTADDLTLLMTLASHLSVALREASVVTRLRHEAEHDPLTGLPNRTLLTQRLQSALHDSAHPAAALMILDLDRFKEVNDTLGHHVGDDLLRIVAKRIVEAVPSDATVSRLGGDEFAVLLPPSLTHSVAPLDVAQRVTAALELPVEHSDAVLSTQASIGIALGGPGLAASDLLRHADTAMYAAKEMDNHIAWYTADLDRGRSQRLALLADLRAALDAHQLELVYQPQLHLASNQVTGVEALVRWRHPRLGVLTPNDFIPLAESTGLTTPLTRIVLDQALAQCRRWRTAGQDLTVAVNLSARSLTRTDLPNEVGAALARAGVPAHSLVLEITESAVMTDPDRSVPILMRLADMGVTLSLDDFGTGYSSLAYLQRLPVQEIKIDRSFVAGLARDDREDASEALLRTIILLGKSLGLRVLAEGVENGPVLSHLRQLGCDAAQGYHIGRPTSPHNVTALGDSLDKEPRHLHVVAPTA
jgi:diguanylate cyclase (GGDEF)-like protein